ncbi:MAG: hypothetical protein JNK40_11330 [Chromatiales bacterium]|nr:hypothetical protein [Chromatiales bacterium]
MKKGRSRPGRAAALVALVLASIVGGLEIWTRQPVGSPVPDLDLPAGLQTLVLVIHGSADADNPLLAEIVTGLATRYRDVPGAAVRYVRWAPESDERLRAAATARAVGRQLGATLAGIGSLRELHLVAHSSGAFMPDAICAAYRQGSARPARIAMTLLDPFQIRGFVDWTYGAREHGGCADFALAVINTDDPAPATNRPLANAFNLDVTTHPGRATFDRNGHYWPLQYYRDYLLERQPEIALWTYADHPEGALQSAPGDQP